MKPTGEMSSASFAISYFYPEYNHSTLFEGTVCNFRSAPRTPLFVGCKRNQVKSLAGTASGNCKVSPIAKGQNNLRVPLKTYV